MKGFGTSRLLVAAVALGPAFAGPALAEDVAARSLVLELNGAQPSEKGCRLTFVVTNGLGTSLDKSAFEIALFDAGGTVERLAVLDFQDLPDGKTKVVRFDLGGLDCKGLSRILVNRAVECAGIGLDAKACMARLETRTKAAVTFGV